MTDPLISNQPIVNEDGTPTDYFLRQWGVQRVGNVSLEDQVASLQILAAEQGIEIDTLQAIDLIAGVALGGGGNLSGPDRTFDLEDTAVTPGAYTSANLTVDQQGRITAAASGSGGGGDPYGIAPTVPLKTNFTLLNPGSATFVDTTFGIFMRVPAGGGSNIRFLNPVAALPATPWTMTTRMRLVHPETATNRYTSSLVLRNSGTGRILIFGDYSTGYLAQRWSGYGTFNAGIFLNIGYKMSDVPWRRVVNDGTTISFEVSPDGLNWAVAGTDLLATYIGSVDQAGAGTWSNNNETSIILQSYTIA